MPYVTASIVIQLLTVAVPQLEQLKHEGESGHAKITQYTRYGTVGLAAAQAAGYAYLFHRSGGLQARHRPARADRDHADRRAATLLMWMGEQITKRGIGNGISILIFASILTSAPAGINAWVQRRAGREALLPDRRARRRRLGRLRPGGPAADPDPVREADGGPAPDGRPVDLHAAAREHGRRHPGHLRRGAARAAADARLVPAEHADTSSTRTSRRSSWTYLARRGAPDHHLHVLLHGRPVQPGRPGRRAAQVRRLHPRHPARARRPRSTSTAC